MHLRLAEQPLTHQVHSVHSIFLQFLLNKFGKFRRKLHEHAIYVDLSGTVGQNNIEEIVYANSNYESSMPLISNIVP